jgi:hypothetical protein
MKSIITLFLLFIGMNGFGQSGKAIDADCDRMLREAKGKSDSGMYEMAIKKLEAVSVHCPGMIPIVNQRLLKIYTDINHAKENEKAAKERAIKESIKSLESYAGKELAEISRLRAAPTNMARTRRLDTLLCNLEYIKNRPIYKTVKNLIAVIPGAWYKKFELPENNNRIEINLNYAGDRLCIVYKDSIEIWDIKNYKKQGVIRLSALPDRAADGDIVWVKSDSAKQRIFFEIKYSDFARAAESSRVRYSGYDFDGKADYYISDFFHHGNYRFVQDGGEREIFSTAYDSRDVKFEGVCKWPVLYNPDLDFHEEIDYKYRADTLVDRDNLVTKFKDYSTLVSRLIPVANKADNTNNPLHDGVSPDMQDLLSPNPFRKNVSPSNLKILAYDRDGHSAIYQASQLADGMAVAGPMPVARVPYAYGDDGELILLSAVIYHQYGSEFNEAGFEPAALNFKMKIALLNSRLISFQKGAFGIVKEIKQDWTNVDHIIFSDDGQKLIVYQKSNDIAIFDLKTEKKNTFLSLNGAKNTEMSPNGKYVFILTENFGVQVWDMNAFGDNGWANK